MKIFDYDDVLLLPKRCIVQSRSECNTTLTLGMHTFKMPIVPANMKSIMNEELAVKLAQNNYFYIMHRFDFDSLAFTKKMKKLGLIASISLGIKENDYALIDSFAKENIFPEYITIDIAHGHSFSVRDMIQYIKSKVPNTTFVIAGNVATPTAVSDLEDWGADAVKVGVGPGKVCITKIKTGFGTGGWQLSAIKLCSKVATKPIIADGGLRVNGDIAKSIRFGATLAMAGEMFASHAESPGNIVVEDGIEYKEFFGSASEYNKKEKRYIEGKRELIKVRGSIFDTLKEMQQDLQSSISYAGGNQLRDLKKVSYVLLKTNEGY